MAGQATIDRITPVAFAFIFALTGSVGPIMGQNMGAGLLGRVRETLRASLLLVLGCVLVMWALLALFQNQVVELFSATGTAAELIHVFCSFTVASFLWVGALFVANAAFNNLGFPLLSTLFNWGRATLGTIPFVTHRPALRPGRRAAGPGCRRHRVRHAGRDHRLRGDAPASAEPGRSRQRRRRAGGHGQGGDGRALGAAGAGSVIGTRPGRGWVVPVETRT